MRFEIVKRPALAAARAFSLSGDG